MHGKSDKLSQDKNAQKEKLTDANNCAKRALELDSNNADGHKWAAITIGSLADLVSLRERIANGLAFHHHLETAMKLKKDDPTLFHLLGRFIIQIVALSWVERKFVNTFVDELPNVDNNQAINYFYDAHQLKPKWRENLFYLAQVLITENRKDEARKIIQETVDLGSGTTAEERELHTKILNLKTKL